MQPITVIIPAYNESGAIGPTLEKVHQVMCAANVSGEIVVVDDGSSDDTAVTVAQYDFVQLYRHPQNKGYGASLKTGIRRAQHEVVLIIDADGTYPIEMIPEVAAQMDKYDMVVGARTGENVNIPLVRRPAKWALRSLAAVRGSW